MQKVRSLLVISFAALVLAACASSTEDDGESSAESGAEAITQAPCTGKPYGAKTCHYYAKDVLLSIGCRWPLGRGWREYSHESACQEPTPGAVCEHGNVRRATSHELKTLPMCIE